jgi:beta-lactamase class C
LERRYARPIGELITECILVPLGMHQTFVPERGPDDRAAMAPDLMARVVQGYSESGDPVGLPGNQQSYYDFPGTGQMFSTPRDLSIFLAACLGENVGDPQLVQALQMTQQEMFRVSKKFGQAMAWENVYLQGVELIDKPGGLNNATAYIGIVPAQKLGVVLVANRGDFPYEQARYRLLPELVRLQGP